MLWGLLILGVLVVATIVVVRSRRASAEQQEAENRRRRFVIPDSNQRMPMAPERAPDSVATLPELPPPTQGDEPPRYRRTPAIEGRVVHTPDGEMILTSPPFALRESIFTSNAGRFMNMLSRRVPAWVMVCPRVRLDSLVTPTKPDGRDPADWREWRRRVRVRSVDVVLVDRRTWRPLVAVLLEPKSGVDARKVAGGKDRMIDEVLTSAGLPLLRLTGNFEKDWPLINPYVEEAILPHMTDEQVLESSMRAERVSGDGAVELFRMDQDEGWLLK